MIQITAEKIKDEKGIRDALILWPEVSGHAIRLSLAEARALIVDLTEKCDWLEGKHPENNQETIDREEGARKLYAVWGPSLTWESVSENVQEAWRDVFDAARAMFTPSGDRLRSEHQR